MKLSIASRGGCVSEDEAVTFAHAIEDQAEHDDWTRVLYAVQPREGVIQFVVGERDPFPSRKSG